MNKYQDHRDYTEIMIPHTKRHRWVRGRLVPCNPYIVWRKR